MLITNAFAQGADASATGGLGALLPLVLIFVVFYFLLIRPQQKKMKQHRETLASIRRGDKIVTGGGILGTVTKVVSEKELEIEIAPDIKVRVYTQMVSEVLSKTEPANDDAPKTGGDGEKKGGLKALLGGKKD